MFPFLFSTLIICNILVLAQDILVQLPTGTIRGKQTETLTNKTYFAFLQIPYAAPPVGNLRFQPPNPPTNWEGILNTTELNVICYQTSSDAPEETEDCLYINVFTPELNPTVKYPVIFYIYGGGFIDGGSILRYCGPEFLLDEDVIVVTFNYRIGPFGFLSTGDEILPGNMGLKDQQFALKWTHDNIALFGGDPTLITIMGQSAGAASVTYQLLNQQNTGLFRGAIALSGSFLAPWSFQRNSRDYAFQTAALMNDTFSSSNDSQALFDFLISAPALEIDIAAKILQQSHSVATREITQGFTYAPVVEPNLPGAFLTQKMYGQLKSGDFIRVPLLTGVTSEEQINDANDLVWLQNTILKSLDDNPSWIVPLDMRIQDLSNRTDMGLKIKQIYTPGLFQENIGDGIRYTSDEAFTHSVIKHAELQSQFTNVYFYQFSYDGIMGDFNITVDGCERVGHSEDLNYIFRLYWNGHFDNSDLSKFPPSDILTHNRLLKIITNFVKTLNPTPEPSELLQNIVWPTVSPGGVDSFFYVDIGENLQILNRPKVETYTQWVQLYDSLGYDDFDTY